MQLSRKNVIGTKVSELDIRPELNHSPRNLFLKPYYVVDYDPKLSDGSSLQRPFCWTLEQKQDLIISIIKGIQIPRFAAVMFDPENGTPKVMKIVDGKQRLSTIQAFMNNEFPIVVNDQEFYYIDFDENLAGYIWNLDMRFSFIYEYPDMMLSDEALVGWFHLINFAGTPQDKAHMDSLTQIINIKS